MGLFAAEDRHALLGLAVFGGHNGVQFVHRVLHGVVDDEIIIGVSGLELHLGPQESLLDLVLTVGAPLGQTAFQLRPAGRSDEDAYGVRPLAGDLDGALDLNVQDDIPALIHGFVYKALGGTVEVPHIFGVLQELVHGDPLAEGLHIHEVVMDAVQLAGTGVPGGSGDGKIHIFTPEDASDVILNTKQTKQLIEALQAALKEQQ